MDVFALALKLQATGQADVNKALKSVGLSVNAVAKGAAVASAAIGAAFVGITAAIIKNTNAQMEALAQLDGALKSTGNAVGFTFKELQQQAADLQKISIFGDDQIMRMQSGLVRFGNISGETFKRTQMAILSVASTGKDLESTMMQLGKAINDPARGMALLRRSGVDLSDAQERLVEQMLKTNNVAGAQAALLEALEGKYGKQIEAAGKTLPAALQRMRNAFGDLWEVPEIVELIRVKVEELTTFLSDPSTLKAVRDFIFLFSEGVARGVSLAASSLAYLSDVFVKFKYNIETGKFEEVGFFAGAKEFLEGLAKQAERLRADIEALQWGGGVGSGLGEPEATPVTGGTGTGTGAGGPTVRDLGVTFTPPEMGDMWANFRKMMEDRTKASERKGRKLELTVPIEPKFDVGQFADIFQRLQQEGDELYAALEAWSSSVANSIVDAFAMSLERAAASGRLSEGWKALGAGLLGGLGTVLVDFGKKSMMASTLMKQILDGIGRFMPQASFAAGLALVALGSAMRGTASNATVFGSGRGGGGGVGFAGAGGMRFDDTFTRVTYGPTNANVAAGMEPRRAMNITVIGPNDPQAQRQIQELISKGARR
jgi:exonuclease VII small subunit